MVLLSALINEVSSFVKGASLVKLVSKLKEFFMMFLFKIKTLLFNAFLNLTTLIQQTTSWWYFSPKTGFVVLCKLSPCHPLKILPIVPSIEDGASFIFRLFGGLISDIRRKLPHYLDDYKDALHVQSLASFMFLYFACLTPIITFGGLLSDATGKDLVSLIFISTPHIQVSCKT